MTFNIMLARFREAARFQPLHTVRMDEKQTILLNLEGSYSWRNLMP